MAPGALLLFALSVFILSLAAHGPAWLTGSLLRAVSGERFALYEPAGLWHEGRGLLVLRGTSEAVPVSWRLRLHDGALEVVMDQAFRGTFACGVLAGCGSREMRGSLPASWLAELVPSVRGVGLTGEIHWNLGQFQANPEGGSGNLSWQTSPLHLRTLQMDVGQFAGRVHGTWSAAEKQPRLHLEFASSDTATAVRGLKVEAKGILMPEGLDIGGKVLLTDTGNSRLGLLLQQTGLPPQGGSFSYRFNVR